MTSERGTPSKKDNGLKMKRIAKTLSRLSLAGSLCIGGLLLSACASEEITKEDFKDSAGPPEEMEIEDIDFSKRKTIFGEGGLSLFGDSEPKNTGGRWVSTVTCGGRRWILFRSCPLIPRIPSAA